MVRRVLVRGAAAAFIATLVPGTAWTEPAASPTHADDRRSTQVLFALGPSPVGTMVGGGSEVVRGWAARRDERTPSGDLLLGALLGALVLGQVASSERVGLRRMRRPTLWGLHTLGPRSPPLPAA